MGRIHHRITRQSVLGDYEIMDPNFRPPLHLRSPLNNRSFDQERVRKVKLIATLGGFVFGIAILILLIFAINQKSKSSGKYETDPLTGNTVFRDPNQAPEVNRSAPLTLQDTQQLYSLMQNYQFNIVRSTIDAYIRSKEGSTIGSTAYIINGDATKQDKENITFNVLVKPSERTFSVRVNISNIGKVSMYFDNDPVAFDALSVPLDTSQNASLSDPLLSSLPYQTSHFTMNFAYTEPDTKTNPIINIQLLAVSNRRDTMEIYIQDLQTYRAEALDFIRSKGVDPANYKIFYYPDPDKPFINSD
jgi:hypothetical protein